MQNLLEVMRKLRAPNGCPWDQEQTHESLRPYLLEEAAEAVDAMADPEEFAGELGDVLLQIAFHAVIAEEAGTFNYQTIENHIVQKLIRRHPHVFADVHAPDSDTVVTNWHAIKQQERGGREKNKFEKIPAALGALARSQEFMKLKQNTMKSENAKEAALATLQNAAGDSNAVANVLETVVAWAQSMGVNAELVLRERVSNKVQAELSAGSGSGS